MNLTQAKQALDGIINKARVHFYKPIQIAEILYFDRTEARLDFANLESYRNRSKIWRDTICKPLLGTVSTSSQKYQDNIFEANAMPPEAIEVLGTENRDKDGIVEAYVYRKFRQKYDQLFDAIKYCDEHDRDDFMLLDFIDLFWQQAGLRRSIDKVYEIIVYSLFYTVINQLDIKITATLDHNKLDFLADFEDFTKAVLNLSTENHSFETTANIYRVGVTNAADRGLDMWSNFGVAIQVKHLNLSVDLAKDIVGSVTADRIIIVCKQAQQAIINNLINQIGWRSKIQSIITTTQLSNWYEKALRGDFSCDIGDNLLNTLRQEIIKEFPSTGGEFLTNLMNDRNYNELNDIRW